MNNTKRHASKDKTRKRFPLQKEVTWSQYAWLIASFLPLKGGVVAYFTNAAGFAASFAGSINSL